MPRSAWASAGASLTPSPTIATTRPSRLQARDGLGLPGRQHARRSRRSIPTSAATACAAGSLSPVSRIGRRPSPLSSATASALVGLTVSATTKTARARPSQAAATAVRPSRSASSTTAASAGRARGPACERAPAGRRARRGRRRGPRRRGRLRPANDSTGVERSPPGCGGGDRAADRMLRGRLEGACEPQRLGLGRARRRREGDERTAGRVVTVPVLSSTTVSIRRVDSSTSGPRIRMPSWAPRPVPTRSAVGVASPSAQGQATIRTATAAENANAGAGTAREPAGERGARQARARSGRTRPPPGRRAAAPAPSRPAPPSTSAAIRASAVSAPTRVRPDDEPPADVDRRAGHLVARPDLDRHALAREQRAVDRRAALDHDRRRSAICSPGRTTNRSPTRSSATGDAPLAAVGVDERDVLRAELGAARAARRRRGAWRAPRRSGRRAGR